MNKMKKKISYTKIYSSECKIFAEMVANNVANIFVNNNFIQQVVEDNLINNIENLVNQIAHDVCHVGNTNEWQTEETFYRIENSEVDGVPDGAIISFLNTRDGGIDYSFSIGNRKIMHAGLIPSMDYTQVLFDEWIQRYQHTNN